MDEDDAGRRQSFSERHELPLMLLPFVAGVGTAIPLWGVDAPPVFFATAAEVVALGAVAMALEGRFFRLDGGARPRRRWAWITRATLLVSVGVGLGFAFGALVRGNAGDPHTAMTAGALALGASAFAVQAIFGASGSDDAG